MRESQNAVRNRKLPDLQTVLPCKIDYLNPPRKPLSRSEFWPLNGRRIEANFADSVSRRVAIHSAAYGACTCGHAWLTLDGTVIANFCTRAYGNRFPAHRRENDLGITPEQEKRYQDQFVEYGEMTRQDVYEACWAFLHDLAFDDALKSDDPLIQTLAVLDRRLGKRRYHDVERKALHPLARKLFETRLAAERVPA